MYYDSHCHIYKEYYDDIDALMDDLNQNNIKLIINNGVDKISSEEILRLINKYPIMYGAIGIHPETVDEYDDNDIAFIKNHIKDNKMLAIGEIGLDYHYSKENKERQIDLFEKQLKIAEEQSMPVIVHSREATADTINVLKKYNIKDIIHSFSGSYETAMIYIKMGYKLGINGVITFKNSNLKDVVEKIGLENIVIETDSPYLTPHPFRGEKNSPKNVKIIVEFLSNLFRISPEKVAEITSKNLLEFFDIEW